MIISVFIQQYLGIPSPSDFRLGCKINIYRLIRLSRNWCFISWTKLIDVIDLTDQDYLKVSNAILGVRGTLRVFT